MRVVRTFAFLDLCGFTSFIDRYGDDAAVAELARLRAGLRSATEQHGVRITKWLGDGAMLSGVTGAAVVACAIEVRDQMATGSPLPLRGGIASGPVIMFEGDDYIGAAVNLAARLCRAAEPNRLLAATDAMPAGLRTRPRGRIAVDGLAERVAVAEVRNVQPARRREPHQPIPAGATSGASSF